MGIFKRVSNMVKAKVNNTLDEMENPIELLDQKIRDMEESLNKAKISSAQILGNAHEIEKKLQKARLESEDYDSKVKLAVKNGNDDLAKRALERKLDADKRCESLQKSYEDASQKSKVIKDKLRTLEEEIEKTRAYRDEAAARFNNAEATKKVNEVLSNVDTGSNSINLDDIERKIERKEAMAEGLGDLRNEDSLEKEFEKLNETNLDDELAKYKNNIK
ncbi:phage shock protein A [Clostridium acetobutylicum]|uniref:Phage shock protein A n=1 Tax=Clostridium acetobutylicum (strain ATCC 824 / DSM 792 / JCM 1419 / IAM 19013 / LMG 5710 / NBRC 13948 / NRRL B-527 / VKM B-1787 / 2291 / W) TaxID=272562 RepID=Q97M85_CLOAB|nr:MULTISPECIES: PspA/IM30 family protein [Clostridium]AAK78294.1 Phage shock protein A [Clostridium acetobutylicum ATCC 824]ADZ19362.1 Phage shock protein A [Clostridium acetobutylicum EA 2018]AEI33906.1 Phage shock protein A [Clostridium acetobutylicum DSM 1731]AWV80020.1 PspA/IM30 family protein [Clostridium acetobutylicum]MBC2395837.1 PspA/IM30 family protein [Clostridium acetobutylicum]